MISQRVYNFLHINPVFCDEIPDELKCNLCKNVMVRSCFLSCGCEYCYKCITNYLNGEDKTCVGSAKECSSRKFSKNEVVESHPTNRKIKQLKVKCPFKSCNYENKVESMIEHIETCEERLYNCPTCVLSDDKDDLIEQMKLEMSILQERINNMENERLAKINFKGYFQFDVGRKIMRKFVVFCLFIMSLCRQIHELIKIRSIHLYDALRSRRHWKYYFLASFIILILAFVLYNKCKFYSCDSEKIEMFQWEYEMDNSKSDDFVTNEGHIFYLSFSRYGIFLQIYFTIKEKYPFEKRVELELYDKVTGMKIQSNVKNIQSSRQEKFRMMVYYNDYYENKVLSDLLIKCSLL